MIRDQVFISYSHADSSWLEQLKTVLVPLQRGGKLKVWADTDIRPGDKWEEEIKKALVSAKVAVLLVSQAFLASDYIDKNELPPLLEEASKKGLTIIWVPVEHCLYEATEIKNYQAVIDPKRPLNSLNQADLKAALVKIAKSIEMAMSSTDGLRPSGLKHPLPKMPTSQSGLAGKWSFLRLKNYLYLIVIFIVSGGVILYYFKEQDGQQSKKEPPIIYDNKDNKGVIINQPSGPVGSINVGVQEPDPSYSIDMSGAESVQVGSNFTLTLFAPRQKDIDNALCSWSFDPPDFVSFSQIEKGCSINVSIPLKSAHAIGKMGKIIDVSVAIFNGLNNYQAKHKFFIIPSSTILQASEIKDVKANIHGVSLDMGPQLIIDRPVNMLYDTFVSTNGENYEKYIGPTIIQPSKEDRLLIKFVSPADGREIGPFEKRGLFAAAEKELLTRILQSDVQRYVTCTPTGCSIDRRVLCSLRASRLTFGRDRDRMDAGSQHAETIYDLRLCDGPNLVYQQACLSSPDKIFPLYPGTIILGHIEYDDGYKIPFKIPVATKAGDFDKSSDNWVELEPIDKKDRSSIPFAAAKLGNVWGPFEVFLGAGGCYPIVSEGVTAFLYDVDGRGLVEASMYGRTEIQFAIPKPSRSEIIVAFDRGLGQRIGPFTYRFDVDKVIRAAALGAKPPRLECSSYGQHINKKKWHCQVPGQTSSLLSWFKVRRIEYGPTIDKINESVQISVTHDDVLNFSSVNRPSPDKILHFSIPEDWADIYYRIEFEDGKTTPINRLPLNSS